MQKSVIRNQYSVLPSGQKGLPAMQAQALQAGQSSIYIIIFIIVIIFAVMLSGGSSRLFSGNHPSSDFSDDPTPIPTTDSSLTPSPTTNLSTTPTPTTTSNPIWSIDIILTGCQTGKDAGMKGTALIKGNADGYMTVDIQNGANYELIKLNSFFTPETTYTLLLLDSLSFNTRSWRINVYQGSSPNGALQKTYDGNPTGC